MPIILGGNGAVGIFFAKTTSLNFNFVLKNNHRRIIEVKDSMLSSFQKRASVSVLFGDDFFSEQERQTLQKSLTISNFGYKDFFTVVYKKTVCTIFKIDNELVDGCSLPNVATRLKTCKELDIVRCAVEYSNLRRSFESRCKAVPAIIKKSEWTRKNTIKLHCLGPTGVFPENIQVVKITPQLSSMVSINGEGILPNKIINCGRGKERDWILMPYGICSDPHRTEPVRDLASLYEIVERLARANQTLLEMHPPRFYGDNKPSNMCRWGQSDDEPKKSYLIDTDEVPTFDELWDGGGPQSYATFQLAGDRFQSSATMMVIYSYMATVAAFCSNKNMSWVYTNTCHDHRHKPKTPRALLQAITCPPRIEQLLENGAALWDKKEITILDLITFFKDAQQLTNYEPIPKRRRISVD